MRIFKNRPLFTSLTVFLFVYVVNFFLPAKVKPLLLILCAVAAIACTVLFILLKDNHKYTSFIIGLCAVTSAIAILLSYFYFDVKQSKYENLSGNVVAVEALVVSEAYDGGNVCGYIIDVSIVNGEKSPHKALLKCEYEAALTPGDKIIAQVKAESFLRGSYGRFDERTSRLSDGLFISYISQEKDALIVSSQNQSSLRVFLSGINSSLSRRLRSGIDGEAGNFASALLLGNRHLLSSVTVRDFSRAGVSHILALSGMHMSVIMGAIMFILKKLRMNRKLIAVLLSVIAILYLGITGFSLSATRAVIMLLFVYLSTLCFELADSLTSLSIAAFIIMLLSPSAMLDAGFWMSFSATLGILVYMPSYNKFINNLLIPLGKRKKYLKPLLSFTSALAAGIFAIIPLIIVMCIFIREMSWWSVLSSAVLSIPSEAVLLLSLIFLPLCKIPYISWFISKAISSLCAFIFNYCGWVSSTKGAVISLNYSFALIFAIIIGAALLYSFAFKSRNIFLSLAPVAVCIFLFFGAIFAHEQYHKNTVKVTYLNCSSISDVIVISNRGEAVICDLSRGSSSAFNESLDAAYESRATEIKAVMLTRYSNSQPSALSMLFGRIMVRELWLPYPQNEDDYNKLEPILSVAGRYGVEVKIYDDKETLTAFSDVNIQKISGKISRSQTPLTLITINTDRERITYAPSSFNECDEINMHIQILFMKSQYVIFGDTGPIIKSAFTLPQYNGVEVIAFADELRAAHIDPDCVDGKLTFLAPELFEIYIEK